MVYLKADLKRLAFCFFLKNIRTAQMNLGGKNAEARAMLEQDEKNLRQIAEHFDRVMIEVNAVRESGSAADGDGGVKYPIKTMPDGKKYVEESRSVLSGNDPAKWRGQIISLSIMKSEMGMM